METKIISNKKYNGGYIGLLMLLIGVAIVALLIVRTDLFSGQKDGKNMIEQGSDAVDEVERVKDLIEQNSRRSAE
jgi:hypothetical protein